MKQLLFLLLFPCLALAQYQGNGNQKITLGEQTTADGLIYRGVLADTGNITPSSDTSAYIILDTVNHRFYNYNRATNVWSMAGVGSISSGLTGVLPVANGGTNTSTEFTAGSVVFAGASGTYTEDNNGLFYSATNNRLGIGTASPLYALDVIEDDEPSQTNTFAIARFTGSNITANDLSIIGPSSSQVRINFGRVGRGQDGEMGYNNSSRSFRLVSAGLPTATFDSLQRLGIGITTPSEKLHVIGNARISAMNGIGDIGASATGVLQAATSDMNLKNTIENSPFGLNEILLLNPVTFLYTCDAFDIFRNRIKLHRCN